MDRLDKIFIKGNVLKAEELNEIVGKINELADASLISVTLRARLMMVPWVRHWSRWYGN